MQRFTSAILVFLRRDGKWGKGEFPRSSKDKVALSVQGSKAKQTLPRLGRIQKRNLLRDLEPVLLWVCPVYQDDRCILPCSVYAML